jgi:hypothetical protein
VDMAKAICASAPGSAAFFNLAEESRELPRIAARKVNGAPGTKH